MNVLRKFLNLVSTLMIIVLLVLTILLVGVRVVGLTPYAVLSGSMEPTYHVGSLIYVKKVDPAQITAGTPITFVVNEDLLVATHRVIDVTTLTTRQEPVTDENGDTVFDNQGNPMLTEVPLDEPAYYFTTKGDANDVADGAKVYYKNVIGTPIFSVPYLGYFSNWLQTRKGMIAALSTVMILMILTFLPDLLRWADDEPKKKPAKQQAGKPRKKKPLTQEEKAMIIARRKERGEALRGPLTQEERALIIKRRKARALAHRQAQNNK
jgi:signal peptidase